MGRVRKPTILKLLTHTFLNDALTRFLTRNYFLIACDLCSCRNTHALPKSFSDECRWYSVRYQADSENTRAICICLIIHAHLVPKCFRSCRASRFASATVMSCLYALSSVCTSVSKSIQCGMHKTASQACTVRSDKIRSQTRTAECTARSVKSRPKPNS